jgi:micrococcal nuclease
MGRRTGRQKSTFVLVLAIVLLIIGYFTRETVKQQAPPAGGPLAAGTYTIARVYDGDSLALENGTKVRLVGIDAPDSKYYMHYADQARTRAKKLLEGTVIRLVPAEEPVDRYKRTLAYVYFEQNGVEMLANAELVRHGLAYAFPYEPNTRHADEILAAQKEAQQARRGLWNRKPKQAPYYIVEVGPKFSLTHRPDCRSLEKSKHEKKRFDKRREALNCNRGAPPCRYCQP